MVSYSEFSENMLKKMLKNPDTFDKISFKDDWQSNLTIAENLTTIKEKYPNIFKEEIDMDKIQFEMQECFKKEQEALELTQKESIKQIEESMTPKIERYYKILHEYTHMVIEGFANSLITIGQVGIGKTFQILNILEKSKTPYVYHSGHRTPLRLFEFLYHHKDGYVLFFDDTVSLMHSRDSINLLLPTLWSTTGVRTVSWFTTSPKANVPPKFSITSKIIFTLNNIPKDPVFKAILSRCLVHEINFDYKTIIKIMAEICKVKHPNLTRDERFEVFRYIQKQTSPSTKNVNLRLQAKAESCFLYAREHGKDFKTLVLPLLQDDKNMLLVQELMGSNRSVNEQIRIFMNQSNLSKRTYHRLKRKLGG